MLAEVVPTVRRDTAQLLQPTAEGSMGMDAELGMPKQAEPAKAGLLCRRLQEEVLIQSAVISMESVVGSVSVVPPTGMEALKEPIEVQAGS